MSSPTTLQVHDGGKRADDAFAQAFNGSVRSENLNSFWFLSLDDARVKCEAWRREYNEVRPHSSIGDQSPMEYAFSQRPAQKAHFPVAARIP